MSGGGGFLKGGGGGGGGLPRGGGNPGLTAAGSGGDPGGGPGGSPGGEGLGCWYPGGSGGGDIGAMLACKSYQHIHLGAHAKSRNWGGENTELILAALPSAIFESKCLLGVYEVTL